MFKLITWLVCGVMLTVIFVLVFVWILNLSRCEKNVTMFETVSFESQSSVRLPQSSSERRILNSVVRLTRMKREVFSKSNDKQQTNSVLGSNSGDDEMLVNALKDDEVYEKKIECPPLSTANLADLLGAAFNARYMAIEEPEDDAEIVTAQLKGKAIMSDQPQQKSEKTSLPFSVDSNFSRILGNKPFTAQSRRIKRKSTELSTGNHGDHSENTRELSESDKKKSKRNERQSQFLSLIQRSSRSTKGGLMSWACESKAKWKDLGRDHFPRYLREIECSGERRCFFGHFTCKERAFTVTILRKRRDGCTHRIADPHLPLNLREEWVFEERAVNFCCECSM